VSRPNSRLLAFWPVQIVGWICFYLSAVITSLPYLKSGALWGGSAFVATTFVASCFLRAYCRWLVQRTYSWIGLEVRAFLCCVPVGIVCAFATALLAGHQPPGWVEWLETSVRSSFILFVWCSLYFSLKLWQQSLQERERLQRALAEVRDARLSALRYQLNPHFLFNSLNAVSTLVLEADASAATKMLSQIADFLRTILDNESSPQTELARELRFAEQYLAIEQTRLGERLRVEMRIDPETLPALVPNMLLQPLIENAVRHGIARLAGGGTIRITSTIHDERLKLSVWDSGTGMTLPSENGGVGLRNTSSRLETLYGEEYNLRLERLEAGGSEVSVEVPLQFRATDVEGVECAH
jgi:two-component system, LytTR family, sensor kinase